MTICNLTFSSRELGGNQKKEVSCNILLMKHLLCGELLRRQKYGCRKTPRFQSYVTLQVRNVVSALPKMAFTTLALVAE